MKLSNLVFLLFFIVFPSVASDDLAWLRDDSRSDTKVLTYLKTENTLTAKVKKRLEPNISKLLKEWQENTPVKSQKPWIIKGDKEYTITQHKGARQLVSRSIAVNTDNTQPITALFNLSSRSDEFDYYRLGAWALNHAGTQLAIAEDTTGSEEYKISVVDLKTNVTSALIEHVDATVLWSQDDTTLYLIKQEKHTLRPFQLIKFTLRNAQITTLTEEKDTSWLLSAYKTSNARYAVIQSNNHNSSEQRLLNLENGTLSDPIKGREVGIEYYLDTTNSHAIINSNIANDRFALYSATFSNLFDHSLWRKFYLPTAQQPLNNFYLFSSGPVVSVGKGENTQLIFLDYEGKTRHTTSIATSGQTAWVSRVGDFDSNAFYIRSMSMVQPPKWEKFAVNTLQRRVYSQDNYPNVTPSNYVTEQIIIKKNGIELPVTLAYRKDTFTNKSPVFLYGYGAYGVTMKPYFMPQILSLLDRGVIYAIAHVRGGGYNGEAWYNAGRGLNRQNAITDFITASNAMRTYQQGQHSVYALGSSAGGTLIASALNQQPKAFQGAVLGVPFVDVINSMSDTSLPLTLQQYSEWGNPTVPAQLAIMEKTDPYLNIKKQAYPPLLVQIGLNDRRVPYWEGAKYLTKLRMMSTSSQPYLLDTHFNQGHSTDRRDALAQQAFEYSFLLSLTK